MTQYSQKLESLRQVYASGITRPVSFRIQQCNLIIKLLDENTDKLVEAVKKDLRKPDVEILFEIQIIRNGLLLTHNYKARRIITKQESNKIFSLLMGDCFIYNEPYGVVLVLGAWNVPILVSLGPLVGAIAGGNCTILKPSELTPATAMLLEDLIPKYLNTDCFCVINGGIPETTELLKEKFDYIFFTGSTYVGNIIYQAAAKHLTPVTLELGGKSPVYIDESVNMDVACRRIMFGKTFGCGQTCVSPDYIICNENVQKLFIKSARKVISEFFHGVNSLDVAKIISEKHFKRLQSYLTAGKIALGGDINEDERYISTTILTDVKESDAVMKEEIFGPILPIFCLENEDEAVKFINKREKPLSIYLFSTKKLTIDKFVKETSSGNLCVNDTLVNIAAEHLPFGGVGKSGLGKKYNGEATFHAFSHQKSVLVRNYNPILEKILSARYPPFTERKKKFFTAMFKKRPNYLSCSPYLLLFLLGIFVAVIGKAIIYAAGLDHTLPEYL